MSTTIADLPALLDGIPRGAWVAISVEENKVLSFGADMHTVVSDAEARGEQHPLIVKVPEDELMMFL